jgi:predicted nucleic-acid-binding Zn-ribbon protein
MTPPSTCPRCGNGTFYGPAEIKFTDEDGSHWYVSCKRCGTLLVVGRDVTIEGSEA